MTSSGKPAPTDKREKPIIEEFIPKFLAISFALSTTRFPAKCIHIPPISIIKMFFNKIKGSLGQGSVSSTLSWIEHLKREII